VNFQKHCFFHTNETTTPGRARTCTKQQRHLSSALLTSLTCAYRCDCAACPLSRALGRILRAVPNLAEVLAQILVLARASPGAAYYREGYKHCQSRCPENGGLTSVIIGNSPSGGALYDSGLLKADHRPFHWKDKTLDHTCTEETAWARGGPGYGRRTLGTRPL